MEKLRIDTPLGCMIAVSGGEKLCYLGFEDRFDPRWDAPWGQSSALASIEEELSRYFFGELTEFRTPLSMQGGTEFQQRVWRELSNIPYGAVRSYKEIAERIGRPKAVRAGALANGANPLSLVIPCHRVIRTGGEIGGYGGKVERKEWLLAFEKKRSI